MRKILKSSTILILKMSLITALMATGSCATMSLVTLQDRTIYTSTGRKLTLEHLILDKPTESFITSGRLARQIEDLTECATLRIDGLGLALWHPQKLLTWQQYPKTLGLESYLRLVQMQRRCSQIRWYQYPLITRSFSNQYRTEWKDQRRNYPTRSRQEDLRGIQSRRVIIRKNTGRGSTQQSTGRTRETTRTMVRNSNSLYMTNRANGNGRTIYSTTGGSRKRASGLEQK